MNKNPKKQPKTNNTPADFIHNDIARCINHRCPINFCCARWRQLQIDEQKTDKAMISVTKFNECNEKVMCDYFLNVE